MNALTARLAVLGTVKTLTRDEVRYASVPNALGDRVEVSIHFVDTTADGYIAEVRDRGTQKVTKRFRISVTEAE